MRRFASGKTIVHGHDSFTACSVRYFYMGYARIHVTYVGLGAYDRSWQHELPAHFHFLNIYLDYGRGPENRYEVLDLIEGETFTFYSLDHDETPELVFEYGPLVFGPRSAQYELGRCCIRPGAFVQFDLNIDWPPAGGPVRRKLCFDVEFEQFPV